MKRTYSVVIERDAAGWYVGSVPSLHGCHSQAKSLDVLMKRMQEVIELCVMEQKEIAASPPVSGPRRERARGAGSHGENAAGSPVSFLACERIPAIISP